MRTHMLTAAIAAALALAGVAVGVGIASQPARADENVAAALEWMKHAVAAYPPSMADVINARGRQVLASEQAYFGQSVSTSTVNAFGDSTATGPAEATFDDDVVQNVRIVNTHASQALCVDIVQRVSAAQTCNAACVGIAAGALTCLAAGAGDGTTLLAGAPPLTLPLSGKGCACVEANAAGTTMQATRFSRAPNL